jgi:hypothetical protein
MPELGARIAILRWLGPDRRLAVLAHAFAAAEAPERPSLAEVLLDALGTEPDIELLPHVQTLLGAWDDLTGPQQARVTRLVGSRWGMVIPNLAASEPAQARLSAARIVALKGLSVATDPIIDLLADPDPAVGDAAEHALHELIRIARTSATPEAERAAIYAGLQRAIEQFDQHRRTGVLRAAVKLTPHASAGAMARGMAWMRDEHHPAHLVMRGVIKRGTEPELRTAAWAWLKFPALASACAERLAQPVGTTAASIGEHTALLSRTALLLNPARARNLDRARLSAQQWATLLPRMSDADDLPVAARSGLVRMLAGVPIDARMKDASWSARLCDAHPAPRLTLARVAIEQARRPGCLLDLVFDADARIARLAADAVLATSATRGESLPAPDRSRLIDAVRRSPHASLRALGRQLGQGLSGTARAARLEDLRAIVAAYRASTDDAHAARRAATAASQAGSLVATMDKALSASPAAGEPRAAIVELLADCLNLPDPRVRANAIDAMVRCGRHATTAPTAGANPGPTAGAEHNADNVIIELLLDRALDPHHRIRASVARGLMSLGLTHASPELTGAGRRTLVEMLRDARPMHRVAGLWLAERFAPVVCEQAEVIDAVSAITQRTGDEREAYRAGRATARLSVETRAIWGRRAARLEPASPAMSPPAPRTHVEVAPA